MLSLENTFSYEIQMSQQEFYTSKKLSYMNNKRNSMKCRYKMNNKLTQISDLVVIVLPQYKSTISGALYGSVVYLRKRKAIMMVLQHLRKKQ